MKAIIGRWFLILSIDSSTMATLTLLLLSGSGVRYKRRPMHVSSSGLPDASGQVNGLNMTFKDLFWHTFNKLGYAPPNETHTQYCFIFELTSPYNKVVIPHTSSDLILLGIRNVHTYVEMAPQLIKSLSLNYKPVKCFDLNSVDDILKSFTKFSGLQQEGYVVVDIHRNRVKVKHPAYVAAHQLKDSLVGMRRVVEIVRLNEQDEVASVFPEFKPLLDKAKVEYDNLLESLEHSYDVLKHLEVDKDFALEAVKTKMSSALFSVRRGHTPSIKNYLQEMQSYRLVEVLGLKDLDPKDIK
jgi:hypothetical protein